MTESSPTAPGGPDWLQERRRGAAETLINIGMPTTESEVWRYSPIDELDLSAFAGPAVNGHRPEPDIAGVAARVLIRDGIVAAIRVADQADRAGLVITAGITADEAPFRGPVDDEFVGVLNRAEARDPLYIDIPRGAVIDGVIAIDHEITSADALVATSLYVRAGADSEAIVVETRRSGAAPGLAVPVVDLDLGDAARLAYIDAQLLGESTWQLGQQHARVGAQATLAMFQVGLGGSYARMRTDCVLAGRGATGNLSAAYLGHDSQTLDFRTFQDHAAPDTTSDLLFKGAVDDDARSIYTGLIRVRPGAPGTAAFQTNRNIKLSERAWAQSVPNLEIENNDVHCSHASSIGPIDGDQRFYLESRGVPPGEADRLILTGFFDEVLGRIPAPDYVDELRSVIADRLREATA